MAAEIPAEGPELTKEVGPNKGAIPSVVLAAKLDDDVRNNPVLLRALKKVDRRLLVWLAVLHFVFKFAETNISNAAIMNLEQKTDIRRQLGHLTSSQWAWCISIFWYPYMVFEPVSTMMVKRYTPSGWFARIFFTWGIVSACQAATQNYAGILVCRFLLGVMEAGFYPSIVYHLSFWYHPDKMPLRLGINYNIGVSSGAVAGLIAYGVSFMNGLRGLSGWRWLFLLEGTPMIVIGVITYFILTDYPQTAKFITEEEREAIIAHLPATGPTTRAKFWDKNGLKKLLRDPTHWCFLSIWTFGGIGGFGVTAVLPNIIYDMGLTGTAQTQLMTMPPYGLAWILVVVFGYFINKKKISAFAVAFGMVITQIICFICLITINHTYALYTFFIVACGCTFSIYPILWPERVRSVEGTTTAAIAFGLTNAVGCLAGIIGPQIFQTKFGPRYRLSYGIALVFLVGSSISVVAAWYFCRRKFARQLQEINEPHGVEVIAEEDGDLKVVT
ncbi:hypothetical protein A1O3_09551 [Capronia epimyces CBS 606.96]|uniref:Major facilitator superfamily (MFS) profile domain-containing protein n=1 Tax=Capronia epimyces CBS 606.96 TaxID=1182542 RepID=W9XIZ8_9EURO|nr:uncharacterized protein A1O3_09551 [Capronia epimyces CBS 606.96]EXJ77325.1 hypothetical protein A1O3_09551 [Capronia epimyces CBS 606.96]